MRLDDRFDELIDTLTGFQRTWLVYLGVELGFFEALRNAGPGGLTADQLAAQTGCQPAPVTAWVAAADAHDLSELRDGSLVLDDETAVILLDDTRPEFLGGQFVHAVVAAQDWSALLDYFRTGAPMLDRPDRYRRSIERLTVQDVAVFFQEALAELPQLVGDLVKGGRVVDIHCGGGRWLIAMARRFPALELVGVEYEPDSVERARANVAEAGLSGRIEIVRAEPTRLDPGDGFDLAYLQYALHQLADPVGVLRAAWAAIRPGGRILSLDWALPADLQESRTRQGELIAGVQLDELLGGTSLAKRETMRSWFVEAGISEPLVLDLPSGATLVVAERG